MKTSYEVTYLPLAEKFFKKAPKNISSHIFKSIEKLAINPHAPNNNIKKLKDPLEGYRLRIGDYRAIYILDISRNILIIANIDHRSTIYK